MVSVVAPQVVKDYWYLISFWLYSQFHIALVVCGTAVHVLAYYVAVILHAVFVVLLHQRISAEEACFLIFCLPKINFVFLLSFTFWADEVYLFHCGELAHFVALAAIMPSDVVTNGKRVQEGILEQTFIANITLCCDFVILPVFYCHNNWMRSGQNVKKLQALQQTLLIMSC